MADSIKSDTFRQDQAKIQLEGQQDRMMKEIRDKHKNDLSRVIENHQATKSDLERAYDIQLSTMQEEHQRRLEEIRQSNITALDDEKSKGEAEVDKTRARYQEQIARYRENSTRQIEDVRRQTDDAVQNLRKTKERGKA